MCCIFSEHLFLKHLWRAAFCHDFLTYNDFRLILGHLKNPFRQIVLALELKSKVYLAKKMSIPLLISLINMNKSTFFCGLFINTKEILNGKLHFCAVLRANKIRLFISVQKQSSRRVLRKKFSENMQQLYRRRRMPKCDIEISLQHACCPVNLLHIFRKPFYKNTFGWLLLSVALYIML